MSKGGKKNNMNLKDLQKDIVKSINEQNNRAIAEFEGYSPVEMHQILHFTFGEISPIVLQQLSDADYELIPILKQAKYLMNLIDKAGEIKLTNKGYLPTKIVADLYQQGILKDDVIERGISKLSKEIDSMTINLTRILIELSGLAKKRMGKLSLTKAGKKAMSDNFKLLKTIIETFAIKFNWAYYDGYGENKIGQLGYGFSLILLSKYGQERRLDSFYAAKYFKAFPDLLELEAPSRFVTQEKQSESCYSLRTFDRFLEYFGLINIEMKDSSWDSDKYIIKTELFDKLIKVGPHNN